MAPIPAGSRPLMGRSTSLRCSCSRGAPRSTPARARSSAMCWPSAFSICRVREHRRMELLRPDEQRLLQDSAVKFLDRIDGRKHARAWRGKDGGFDRKCLREIGELGWLAMLVPDKLGGMGCGPYELALLLQQAGRALAPHAPRPRTLPPPA